MGEQTSEPLIAQLFSKYQVVTNILYGNVEIVQQVPIGRLIVVLSGEETQRAQARSFLAKQQVKVTVLDGIQAVEPEPKFHVI